MAKDTAKPSTDEPARQPSDVDASPAKAKKSRICAKIYIDGEGGESRYPSPDTVSCEMRFGRTVVGDVTSYGNAGVLSFKLDAIGDKCRVAAAWHGAGDKLANSYNKEKVPAEAFNLASAMLERLVEDEWTRPGEGAGPSTFLLVDAIVRLLLADGEEVDEERKATIRAKVQGKEARAQTLANPIIDAMYKTIQSEKAAVRAAAAGKVASDSGASLEGF